MRAAIPKVKFTDVTENSGLAFDHENGARGEKLLPETMGEAVLFWIMTMMAIRISC